MQTTPKPAPRTANAVQAGLLLDVSLRPLLSVLMQAPCTAREVSVQLDVNMQRAYYLLRKLAMAGVADVMTARESGQVVKRYGVAPQWFIPYEITQAETLHDFLAGQILPRMARFVHNSVDLLQQHQTSWGYWLERGEVATNLRMGGPDGAAHALFAGDEPFLLNIGTAHLTRAGAVELKRRLLAVLAECEQLEAPEATTYTISMLLGRGGVG